MEPLKSFSSLGDMSSQDRIKIVYFQATYFQEYVPLKGSKFRANKYAATEKPNLIPY